MKKENLAIFLKNKIIKQKNKNEFNEINLNISGMIKFILYF